MERSHHLQLSAWLSVQNTNNIQNTKKGKIPDANFLNITPTVLYHSIIYESKSLRSNVFRRFITISLDVRTAFLSGLGSCDKVV